MLLLTSYNSYTPKRNGRVINSEKRGNKLIQGADFSRYFRADSGDY